MTIWYVANCLLLVLKCQDIVNEIESGTQISL